MKNLKKMMLQCVILDWDGTLVTAEPMIHQAYLLTMKHLDINPNWNEVDTHRQNGRSPAYIFANKKIWGEKINLAKEVFYKELDLLKKEQPELLQLKDGAVKLLELLCKLPSHPRIVILANKTQSILSSEIKQLQLLDFVDLIIGSSHDARLDKPNPSVFERANAGLSIAKRSEEVVHIGDNPLLDPAFANIYGAYSILVASHPNAEATDLQDLIKQIEEAQ